MKIFLTKDQEVQIHVKQFNFFLFFFIKIKKKLLTEKTKIGQNLQICQKKSY